MALINCPECGKEISDKAPACPHCGYPIIEQPVQPKESEDNEEYVFCPKCMSTHVHTEQKGFSGGKALAGAVAFGGLGLLAGTIGSKNVLITCLKCGHKFKAGDAFIATRKEKDEILQEFERIALTGDKLEPVKFLSDRLHWSTAQSFQFIDDYLSGHPDLKKEVDESQIKSSGKIENLGCFILVMIVGIIIAAILGMS